MSLYPWRRGDGIRIMCCSYRLWDPGGGGGGGGGGALCILAFVLLPAGA